jgi:predicted nucleic acid-binding protein
MKLVVDANVLYPTVLRELVLGAAESGAFTPLWSARLLEEWRRAALRQSEKDGLIAEGEIVMAKTRFPDALVTTRPETAARLYLPDPDDVHVLAAAIDGGADGILTLNARDFPTNPLAAEGLYRRDPDNLLLEAFHADETGTRRRVQSVIARAGAHGIDVSNPRALLKRARVPRLGKALFS